MRSPLFPPIRIVVCVGFLLFVTAGQAQAQTTLSVSDDTQLRNAVMQAAGDPGTVYIISLSTSITLSAPLVAVQAGPGGLTINGNGNTLTGVGGSLFTVQTGQVTIQDLVYSDDTTVLAAGTVLLNAGDSLGTGGIRLNNGALRSENAITVANAVEVLGTNAAWNTNGNDTTLLGTLSGSGNFTKIGAGTFTLGGTNTSTGTINVGAGTLRLGLADGLAGNAAVFVDDGALLDFNDNSQAMNELDVQTTGNVALGSGTLTLNGGVSFLLGGMTGSGGLVVDGAFTQVRVEGQLSYTGGTTVSEGLLWLVGDNVLGGAVTLNAGFLAVDGDQTVSEFGGLGGILDLCFCKTLTVDQSTDTAFSGEITGEGSLVKSGTGTLELTGNSSFFLGATTVTGGTIAIGTDTSLGDADFAAVTLDGGALRSDAAITVDNNVALGGSGGTWNTNGNDTTLSGDLTGVGAFTKTGSGTLTLTGNNSNSGGTTVSDGTLRAGIASAFVNNTAYVVDSGILDLNGFDLTMSSLSGAGGQVQLGAALLTVDQFTDTTFAGTIAGSGALHKSGTGTLTLSNTQAYTGVTAVLQGTLQLTADNALASSERVFVVPSTTLDIADTAQTFNALSVGPNGTVILGTGTLTLESSTAGLPSTLIGSVTGTGGLVVNGADTMVFIEGPQAYTGGTTINDGTVFLNVDDALSPGSALTLNGGFLFVDGDQRVSQFGGLGGVLDLCFCKTLTVDQSTDTTFAGEITGGGSLVKTGTGTLALTFDNSFFSGATTVTGGTIALGTGTSLGSGDVTLDGGGLRSDAAITVDNNIEFGAGGGTWDTNGNDTTSSGDLTGAGAFIKAGAGTLVLQGTNGAFSGGTTVTGGVVALTANDSLGTGGVTLDGGGLRSDAAITFANGITLGAGGGSWNTNGNDSTLTGDLTGAGAFTKTGAGALILQGNNSAFSGATTVTGGVVALTANDSLGTGGVTLDGGGVRAGNALTLANNVTFGASGGTVDTTGNAVLLSGDLMGPGGLTIDGSGVLVLSGLNNTYSGGTIVNGGVLAIGANDSLGTGNVTLNGAEIRSDAAITVANGFIFGASGGSWDTNGNNTTLTGNLTGVGGFTKEGTGILTLAGANTYLGATMVAGGTLQLASNNALASSAGVAVDSFATLDFANTSQTLNALGLAPDSTVNLGSGTLTIDDPAGGGDFLFGSINGSGGLVVNGPNTAVLLFGQQSYTGGTTVSNGAILSLEIDNALSPAGALTINSGGLVTVNADQTVSELSGIGGLLDLCACFTFTVNQSTSTTFAGDIVNGGALIKTGIGTLALTGDNSTWTGSTTVTGGTLALGNDTSLGDAAFATVTLDGGALRSAGVSNLANNIEFGAGGGTWDSNGNDTTLSGVLTGGGGFTKTGTGTLTLSGFNTYTGETTINAGTLALDFTGVISDSSGVTVGAGGTFDISGVSGVVDITTLAGSGAVQLGDSGLVITNASTEFSGTIDDGGNFGALLVETGTLTLSGASTYSGDTGIADGAMLALKDGGSIANSLITFEPGATLATLDLSQTTSGTAIAGLLDFTGGGAVRLGSRTLTITQGGLFGGVIQDGGIAGGSGGGFTVGANAMVELFGVNTYTGATIVQGDAALVLTDAGDIAASSGLNLAGANAVFDISCCGGDRTIKDLTGVADSLIELGDNSLRVGTANSTTFAGDITNGPGGTAGGLEKIGSGTLILTGDSAFAGGTTVTAGRLQIGTTGITTATLAADVNVAGGALGGTGTITGTVNIGAGATLAPGASIGTLTTGTLVLNAASILDFEFGAPGISDRVIVNGNLTLDGTLNVIDAGGFGAGVYRLFDYTGLFSDGGLSIGATPAGVVASQLQIQTSVANQVNLISAAGTSLTFWDGNGPAANGVINGGSGVWSATAPRWTDATGVASGTPGAGAFVIFQGAPGIVTIDNSAGAIGPSGLQFAANGYEVTGGALTLTSPLTTIRVGDGTAASAGMMATISAPLTGSGGLLKTDFGTLFLTGNNTYSGATQIDAGTLLMGSSTALGTSGRLTIGSAGTLDLGGFSLELGSIEGTGTVALASGALTLGAGGVSSTFAGRLTGGGLFAKIGAGTLTLTGANTNLGLTHVHGGTLAAGAANVFGASAVTIESGATLDLNHHSQSIGSLSGGGQVALGSATLVTGLDGRGTAYNGSITGTGSVVKVGGGTWILGGFNTYSGATQIEAGTLRLASGGALSGTSGVTVAGAGTLDLNGFSQTFGGLFGTGQVTLGGASLTLGARDGSSLFGGTISGDGAVRKIGAGVLQLTGAHTYTGGTFVDGGALVGDSTSLRGAIVNNALVAFDQQAAGIFNGSLSGTGGVIKQGNGLLTLLGRQAYTGGTTVSAGTLQGTTDSLQGTIVVDSALRFDQAFTGLFAGVLGGTGTLAKAGTGTLMLNGGHAISGATTVEAGTLWLDGSLGGSVTVRSGARFVTGGFPATASAATMAVAPGDATSSEAMRAPREAWMTAAADVTASIGALGRTHVAGDVTLQPGSTYEARINAAGDSVLLSSGGTVRAGAATIVVDGGAGTFPRVVQAALITSAGGLLGEPTIQAPAGLETIVTSDGDSLFLTVLNSSALLAPVAGTVNGEAFGAAIDRLRPSSAGDLAAVTREMAALSDADLAVALDGTSGEIFATSMHATAIDAEATADRIRGEVARRRRPTASRIETAGAASTAAPAQAWGTGRRWWGQLGGERARLDSTASAHAADGHVGGFAIGVDWTSGGGWLAGAGGGYALGEMTLSGGASNAETTAPRAFGYAGYARGRWTLQGGATVGRTTYDTRRQMAFAARLDPRFGTEALFGGVDRTATSTSHGVDTSGWLDARLELVRGSWQLQPGAGLRTARYGRGEWTETGADALSFSAASQAIRSSQMDAGLRVSRLSGRVRPAASASYRRELGDGATSLTLQISPDAAGRFTVGGVPFATDRMLGTLGVTMDMWWFGYGIDAAAGQTRHTVNFGVNFE